MPNSNTSYLDAIDHQDTITSCYKVVLDLIESCKDPHTDTVVRNTYAQLLCFLYKELIRKNSWFATKYSPTKREQLFFQCYRAISELTDPAFDFKGINRDNLFILLTFLHEASCQVNDFLAKILSERHRDKK